MLPLSPAFFQSCWPWPMANGTGIDYAGDHEQTRWQSAHWADPPLYRSIKHIAGRRPDHRVAERPTRRWTMSDGAITGARLWEARGDAEHVAWSRR